MTPNTFHFTTGTNATEVLRLSKNGIWANPDIPADEAAKLVLEAIDHNIKVLVQKAVEDEREACVKQLDALGCDHCATAIRERGEKHD